MGPQPIMLLSDMQEILSGLFLMTDFPIELYGEIMRNNFLSFFECQVVFIIS